MSKSLSFALVLSATGTIDREQSLASAESALDSFISESETQDATIAAAVEAVFDAHRGVNLTMPTIAGMTLRHLNVGPANYKTQEKRVLDYVRANADKDGKRSGTRLFGIQKGKNGGVCRWSDVPEAPASTDSK